MLELALRVADTSDWPDTFKKVQENRDQLLPNAERGTDSTLGYQAPPQIHFW